MGKSKVTHREQLAQNIYKMTFSTDDCRFSRPGQYALIRTDGLCRPYQVCDYDSDRYTVVFNSMDRCSGTLVKARYGDVFESRTGLGNGFDVDVIPRESILVADSMGVSEMLELARTLLTRGKKFKMVLGYYTKANIYMVDSFRNICNEIDVITLDGSNGREGLASDVVRNAEYVCASGSPSMLKALAGKCRSGQFSLSDMMRVSVEENGDFDVGTLSGMLRCSETGPVYDKNSVDWGTLSLDRWSRSTY